MPKGHHELEDCCCWRCWYFDLDGLRCERDLTKTEPNMMCDEFNIEQDEEQGE